MNGIEIELPVSGRTSIEQNHRHWQRRVLADILPDSPNADAAEKIPFRFVSSLTTARKTTRFLDEVFDGEFAPLEELFVRDTRGTRGDFPIAFHVLPVKSTRRKIESRAFSEKTILLLCRRPDGSLDEPLVAGFLNRFRQSAKSLDLAQRLLLDHLEPDWDRETQHVPEFDQEVAGPPPFAADACALFQRDLRTLLAADIPSGDFFELINSILSLHLGLYQLRVAYRLNRAIRRVEGALLEPAGVDIKLLELEEQGKTRDTTFVERLNLFVPPTRGDRQIAMTAPPRLSYQEAEKELGELHFSLMLFHRLRELTASYLRGTLGIRDSAQIAEMVRWPSQLAARLQTSPEFGSFLRESLRLLVVRFAHDQLSEDRRELALERLEEDENPLSTLRFCYELYNLQPPAQPTKNRAYRQGIIVLNSLLSRGEYGIVEKRPRVGGYFEFGVGLLPLLLLTIVGSRGEKVQLDVFWASLAEYGFTFTETDREELLARLRSMGLYERFSDAGAANYIRSLLIVDDPEKLRVEPPIARPREEPRRRTPVVAEPSEPKGVTKRPGRRYLSEQLRLGEAYSRRRLAEILEYKTINALASGVVTPVDWDTILLFVSQKKQSHQTQYEDHLVQGRLFWEGQDKRRSDPWIAGHRAEGRELLLFYRRFKDELPDYGFHFLGEVVYVTHATPEEGPSRFVFDACHPELLAPFHSHVQIDSWMSESDAPGRERAVEEHQIPPPAPVEREPTLELKDCPKCGERKEVEAGFGYRLIGETRHAQSWCRDCRAGRPSEEVTSAETAIKAGARAVTSPPVEDPLETWLRTDIETLRPSGRLRYSLSALSIVDYGDLLAFDVRESHLHGGGKKAQELSILKQQVLSSLPKANRRDAERRALLRQRFRESMLATPDELAEHLDVSRDEVRRLLSAWPERVSRLSEDLFVWHPTSGSDDAEELLARAEGELWSAYDAELRSAAAHVDDLDTWAVAVLLSYFVHTNANGIVQHLANRLADKVRAGSEHSEVLSVPSQEDRPATKPPAAPIRRDAQPPPTPPREERPEPPTSPNDSTAERRLQERFMTNLARLDLLPWDHARQLADDVGVKDVDYVLREMTRERKLLRLPHNYFMLPTTKERIFSRWPKRERMLRKLLDGDWAACSADALFFLAIFFDRIGTEDRAVTEILNHLFSRQDVDPEIMAEVADLRFARSMEMQ